MRGIEEVLSLPFFGSLMVALLALSLLHCFFFKVSFKATYSFLYASVVKNVYSCTA